MSDVTMEQKLQLVRQIRSRYNENQYDMSNRERILYGKFSHGSRSMADGRTEDTEAPERISFFKLRFLLALLFFLTVVVMDTNDMKVAGITTEKIYRAISADYEEKIDEWVEAFAASYSSPQR